MSTEATVLSIKDGASNRRFQQDGLLSVSHSIQDGWVVAVQRPSRMRDCITSVSCCNSTESLGWLVAAPLSHAADQLAGD